MLFFQMLQTLGCLVGSCVCNLDASTWVAPLGTSAVCQVGFSAPVRAGLYVSNVHGRVVEGKFSLLIKSAHHFLNYHNVYISYPPAFLMETQTTSNIAISSLNWWPVLKETKCNIVLKTKVLQKQYAIYRISFSRTVNLLTLSFFPSSVPFSCLPPWLYSITPLQKYQCNYWARQINVDFEMPGSDVHALFSRAVLYGWGWKQKHAL